MKCFPSSASLPLIKTLHNVCQSEVSITATQTMWVDVGTSGPLLLGPKPWRPKLSYSPMQLVRTVVYGPKQGNAFRSQVLIH